MAPFLSFFQGYCEAPNSGSSPSALLSSLCDTIMSDSTLFFMFRVGDGVQPAACPFGDATHDFGYSTRGGQSRCEDPPSQLDRCTGGNRGGEGSSRMVFRFRACADVGGSESGGT